MTVISRGGTIPRRGGRAARRWGPAAAAAVLALALLAAAPFPLSRHALPAADAQLVWPDAFERLPAADRAMGANRGQGRPWPAPVADAPPDPPRDIGAWANASAAISSVATRAAPPRAACARNAVTGRQMCNTAFSGSPLLEIGSANGRWAFLWADGNPRIVSSAASAPRWRSAVQLRAEGCPRFATRFGAGGRLTLSCRGTVWATFSVVSGGVAPRTMTISDEGVVRFWSTGAGRLLLTIRPGGRPEPASAWNAVFRRATKTSTSSRTRSRTSRTSGASSSRTASASPLPTPSPTATAPPSPTSTTALPSTSTAPSTTSSAATAVDPQQASPAPLRFPIQPEVGIYFTQWSPSPPRSFTPLSLLSFPSAANATFLNYAFGNIYPQPDGTYACGMVTRAEGGDGAGGDAWADYQRPFAAGESVDGVGDAPGARLRGNFNQLRKLKARLPGLRVFISIGGWTWSRWFSAAARTEALRKNLASSCVDLYLRGNLPELEGAGGAEAGRGVFDGIDIDWEYPGIQGIGYNTLSPDDGNNFSLLLAEVRRQLDLLSEETGLAYGLTAAVGAGRHTVDATDPAEYSKHLDWVNAMTYDFRGAWDAAGPTGFHARLLSDPAAPDHPHGTTAAGAIDYLLAKGVPASKLLLGVPFYGRGWTGVDPRGGGVYRPALGPAPGTFEAGAEDYRVLCGAPGTERFRAEAGQAYRFDDATGTWWAYDNPEAVAGKAAFARERGLRGLFAWAADGDRGGELLAAMAAVRG